MKKQIILVIALLMIGIASSAQKLPDWIINKPSPTNSTYLYVVESATGQTEMEARNRAIGEVFRTTAMRIGQPIDSEEINRALQRGTEYYVISSQYNVPINKVCEYTDNKTSPCRVYVLCQVAKAGNIRVEFDDFNACYEGANKVYADEALYADANACRSVCMMASQHSSAALASAFTFGSVMSLPSTTEHPGRRGNIGTRHRWLSSQLSTRSSPHCSILSGQ